jgi:hypothetical protein
VTFFVAVMKVVNLSCDDFLVGTSDTIRYLVRTVEKSILVDASSLKRRPKSQARE